MNPENQINATKEQPDHPHISISTSEKLLAESIDLAAEIYRDLPPNTDLSSKSTFSLLASLALIGLSLASAKPQSVEVLGFTISAGHWLLLAFVLASIVIYSITQVHLLSRIEKNKYKHLVQPKLTLAYKKLNQTNAELSRLLSDANHALSESITLSTKGTRDFLDNSHLQEHSGTEPDPYTKALDKTNKTSAKLTTRSQELQEHFFYYIKKLQQLIASINEVTTINNRITRLGSLIPICIGLLALLVFLVEATPELIFMAKATIKF